ncbi:hypothetical protein ACHAXT_005731 [Thalassiosira profunda]
MVVQKGRADAAMAFALVIAAVVGSHSVIAFAPTAPRHLIRAPPTSKVGAREFCPPPSVIIGAASASALDVATASTADEREASSPEPLASVDALDKLVPRQTIRELSKQKSNIKGWAQTAFHFGLVALAACSAQIVGPLSLLATAFVSSFYFNGLHETIHRTAFRSNFLNDAFAHVFGFLCLRPARHYYHYHWQHHRYTGNPKLDSELQPGLLDFPVDNVARYALYLSGIPFWGDAIPTTAKHAFGKCDEAYLTNERAKREVVREARIYLALYACIAAWAFAAGESVMSPLLRFWVLPAVLGQPCLRFYLLAEHRGRKESPLIYENTRTMAGTNAFYRKLAWQMPFHAEHHAWPTLPFHQLHTAHDLLVNAGGDDIFDSGETHSELKGSGRGGYLNFNRRLAGLLRQHQSSKRL